MLSIVEKQFVRGGRVRADGRAQADARKVNLRRSRNRVTGQAQCEVKLGETVAFAVVSAAAVAPFPDRPNEGILKVNVALSGGLSGLLDESTMSGRQYAADKSVRVSSILEYCLLETKAVDLEGLCIVAGRKVWHIRVDLSILNDAGNAIDVGALAAFGALNHFRRPDVSVVGESVKIYNPEEREPVPLALHHTPLCITFALFHCAEDDNSNINPDQPSDFFLLDPTDREELAQDGQITVIVNSHKEVCGIFKHGWPPLSCEKIAHLVQIAVERSPGLAESITS